MGKIRVHIKHVDTRKLRIRFAKMSARSKNFAPVFRWALRELENAHAKNFAAQGAFASNRWKPLDTKYAAWKLANYGAGGILVRSGDFKSSLTDWNSRGAVREIGRVGATFGTSLPIAGFHQYGTHKMAKRPAVFTPRTFSYLTAQAVAEHVVYGGDVGSTYHHLKRGLFPT
jgi:phage gpG-like protein